MLSFIFMTMSVLRNRLHDLRDDDRGMTTEAIVVTGLLVVLAIAAIGVIAAAVNSRADRIGGDIEGTFGYFGIS